MTQSDLTRWTNTDTDQKLIEMWLHNRSPQTQAAYRQDTEQFLRFAAVPLRQVTLEALQQYLDELQRQQLKPASQRRKINSLKSLFTFATKLNYVPFNVAAALRLKKAPTKLAQRILRVDEVKALLEAETDPRNKAFLRFLYASGVRVSEACNLTWQSFRVIGDRQCQVYILGKGDKDRYVIVPWSVWLEVAALRGQANSDQPVFGISRQTGDRIIKAAGKRVGLIEISCHWLRHAHALHSLKAGAPIHLVRDTLGHSSIAVTNVYLESLPDESSSQFLGF